jgi:hypothetical protein
MSADAAMDAYCELCLDLIERDEHHAGLPDPAEHLRGQGLEDVADASLHVHHRVLPIGVAPEQITCPDGSWGCRYVCRTIRGEQHCTYVCRCP